MGISKAQFANEIERYFFYHSIRKTNVQNALTEQISFAKDRRGKIISKQSEMSNMRTTK